MFDDESSDFSTLTQDVLTTLYDVFVRKYSFFPLLDTGVNLESFTVRGRSRKLRTDLQQWVTDDPACFFKNTEWWKSAFHKKVVGRGIHPFKKIWKKNDSRWVAIPKHHFDFVNDCF